MFELRQWPSSVHRSQSKCLLGSPPETPIYFFEQEQAYKSIGSRARGAFGIQSRTLAQLNMNAVATIFVVIFSLVIGNEAADRCHLRELDLCAATGATSNRIPTSEADIDKQCKIFQEVSDCFGNFTKLCATPIQREIVNLLSEGVRDTQKKFCTRGDKLRSEYLKHAPCLAKAQPHGRICIEDVKVGLQTIEESKFSDRIPTGCCVYNRYSECATKTVETNCGADAIEYGTLLLRVITSNLPEMTCQGYKNNAVCDTLLPPSGTRPKSSGKGVVSRLFNAYYS